MKFLFSILLVFVLSSCSLRPEAMTNDAIIAETKKCQSAGMDSTQIGNFFDYSIIRVTCVSSNKPTQP